MNNLIKKVYLYLREAKDQILVANFGFITSCKHTPTCSVYMAESIKKKGLLGFLMGLKRIVLCIGFGS